MGLCTKEILNHLKYQTILLNMQRERLLKLLEQLFFFQTVTSVCIPAVGKEVSSWSQQRKSRCCQEIYWDWRSVWGMAPVSQFKDCDKTDCRGGVLVFHPCEHFCVGVCEEGSIPCSWPRVKMESGNVKVAWEWDCPPMILCVLQHYRCWVTMKEGGCTMWPDTQSTPGQVPRQVSQATILTCWRIVKCIPLTTARLMLSAMFVCGTLNKTHTKCDFH